MLKKEQLKTDLLVCMVITIGFAIAAVISYQSNSGIYREDIEHVTTLTTEGIYYQITSIFTKPVNVSLTMANDSLLKDFLEEENLHLEDADFVEVMREYLNAYRVKYDFDSVFLVSTGTNRYYHFNGVDRVLEEGDPEDVWYYQFLDGTEEYSLNIDNDEAAHNEITVFINCKIKNVDGSCMGVVGVGFQVNSLQQLLKDYEDEFGVSARLINQEGLIEISTNTTGFERLNLFDVCVYPDRKQELLSSRLSEAVSFWHSSRETDTFVVSQYIPELSWHLIVENNIKNLHRQFLAQMIRVIAVLIIIIILVVWGINILVKKYNERILELMVLNEQKHQAIFKKETESLYENIYELDVTHDCAASESTEEYFRRLGISRGTPFHKALRVIARKQIKEEFREGYISTFCPENILKTYQEGGRNLSYDFQLTEDGEHYYWMRITARIFYWEEDKSIRMMVYRQNIDVQKRQESSLMEKMQQDSLTGLYNKAATKEHISFKLRENPELLFAFFIVDIDNFKQVNDRFGHAVGDEVIADFAAAFKAGFSTDAVVGRIGGDEFAAFLSIPSREWAERKAKELASALRLPFLNKGEYPFQISGSIGVALSAGMGKDFDTLYRSADSALYETKKNGKNGYTIFRGKDNMQ